MPGKGEDAGGLARTKDDNAARRKTDRWDSPAFKFFDYKYHCQNYLITILSRVILGRFVFFSSKGERRMTLICPSN
ncbi:MAG: hypothetical protein K0S22_2149 [Oscillospiraceae bacterium]|nr:hypothetical protein [Oscillospiraceae bacterium]